MNNSCPDKYIIAFIDTENVPSNCFSGLASLVEYKYKNHKNAGYYCYGIDDEKSTVSCGWKQQTDKLKGLKWVSVKGEREKNLVDNSIIKDIKKLLETPKFSRIDIWVIVTSDGDYESAIRLIMSKGHKVVIASNGLVSDKYYKLGCEIYRL